MTDTVYAWETPSGLDIDAVSKMSSSQAAATLRSGLGEELSNKYLNGDGASRALVDALIARKANADETEQLISAVADTSVPLPRPGGPNVAGISAADLRATVSWLKQDGVSDEFIGRLLRGDTLPPEEYARYETGFRIEKFGNPEWRDRLSRGDAVAERELKNWMCLVTAQKGAHAPSIGGRW